MYDYIIIGSGIAGLFTALLASEHGNVLLLTKGALEESNTRYAQGGIAAAMAPEDSPALHMQDTLEAGAGLCDSEAVRILTAEGPERIRDLLQIGVPFDRRDGKLALGLEAAHQARRILHAGGDATGFHVEMSLSQTLRAANVTIVESAFVTEIIVEDGRATGVRASVAGNGDNIYHGQHIVLASGGAGQLFCYTTNPAVATGDGIALAYRAGAALADVEFYQFHPTALRIPGAPTFLVSEAVRGEGAYLRTADGERFMLRYDPRAELAPRDVVSRAIAAEMARTGASHVSLDLRHLQADTIPQRFPTISAFCQRYGLDMASDLLPVAPAAHYFMGGVRTNIWGETTLPGLYACGETACTGVHGANRLASNSLLEGLVFGARIVQRTLQKNEPWAGAATTDPNLNEDLHLQLTPSERAIPAANALSREALQQLMWEQVGLVRNDAGLGSAIDTLSSWQQNLPEPQTVAEHELHNLLLLGWLMASSARRRTESRGAHYRDDAPKTEPWWRRRIVLTDPATVDIVEHPDLIAEGVAR